MNVWKYEKISDKFVRSCMKLLNVPIRITFYTLLGRVLVFLGDKFCQYSLDLEGIGWMRVSLLLWSIGVWFYSMSNKYAWIHITDANHIPTKKYSD